MNTILKTNRFLTRARAAKRKELEATNARDTRRLKQTAQKSTVARVELTAEPLQIPQIS